MNGHLENVRAAAGRQDRVGASRELDAFAVDVAQQKAAGRLSAADYAALETGIGRARARIGIEVVPPTPTAATVGASPVSVSPSPSSAVVSQAPPSSDNQPAGDQGPGKTKDKAKPGNDGGKAKGNGGD